MSRIIQYISTVANGHESLVTGTGELIASMIDFIQQPHFAQSKLNQIEYSKIASMQYITI